MHCTPKKGRNWKRKISTTNIWRWRAEGPIDLIRTMHTSILKIDLTNSCQMALDIIGQIFDRVQIVFYVRCGIHCLCGHLIYHLLIRGHCWKALFRTKWAQLNAVGVPFLHKYLYTQYMVGKCSATIIFSFSMKSFLWVCWRFDEHKFNWTFRPEIFAN